MTDKIHELQIKAGLEAAFMLALVAKSGLTNAEGGVSSLLLKAASKLAEDLIAKWKADGIQF